MVMVRKTMSTIRRIECKETYPSPRQSCVTWISVQPSSSRNVFDILLTSIFCHYGKSRLCRSFTPWLVSDTINHQILLDKLKEWFGLGGHVLEWVVNYLKHCFQSVQIQSIHLYADDTQVYNSYNISSFNDSIQNSLVTVLDWMYKNKLKLNPDKTEFLLIGNKCYSKALESFPSQRGSC